MALHSSFGPFLPQMLEALAAAVPKLRYLHVKVALTVQLHAIKALAGFEHLHTLGWTAETVEGAGGEALPG